ncbi:hypothetical protein B0J17DRAFT_659480 [Rhizoctonia solani]|nr:hypothetical protein B0J17DRAFT_659480 [Rhizoctonia solani]
MPDPPCHPQACSLQSCLNKNTYSPDKCDAQLRNYTNAATRSACPIPRVVTRWLKTHPK